MSDTIRQSNLPTDANLKDVLDLWKRDIFMSFSSHHIGTIQSFNSNNQTANATINYKKTYFKFNDVTKKYDSVLQDYPQVIDCPVICLGGGGASLTFPIQQGDECLILFNDRDMDNWFGSGSVGAGVNTPRMHSFSDGIILVGVRSLANSLSDYDGTRAALRNGVAQVAVGPALIKIANTITLGTVLTNLTTALQTFSTGLNPGNLAAQAAALSASITTIAAQIASLLE